MKLTLTDEDKERTRREITGGLVEMREYLRRSSAPSAHAVLVLSGRGGVYLCPFQARPAGGQTMLLELRWGKGSVTVVDHHELAAPGTDVWEVFQEARSVAGE